MDKTKYILGYRNAYFLQRYRSSFSIFISFIVLLFVSNAAFALAPNPGAVCSANFSQGSFTNADYSSLVAAVNTNNYVNIAGNASGSIPLQVKINTVESSTNTTRSNFGVITTSGTSAINIQRTFPNPAAFTDILLEFRNTITAQPIYLTNVALSAFDVDYANSNGNTFDDYIQITGVTQTGASIEGTFQPITGSNILYAQGLYTNSTFNCPAKDLNTQCQGSIQFSQPVTSVRIRYTNTGRLPTSTNQEVDLRIDNYCYIPQYIFTGTVFDDNGGITATQADATNDDITSSSSAYTNRPNYFNGVFNAPQELGISGSTVRLVSCTNTATTYATQAVNTGAPIGQYQFSVPISTFNNNTNICLIEDRSGTTYPIRTSSDNRNVGFATTTYLYPNNNFGRVIAANAALVLKKAQYINNCPTTLNYTDPAINTVGNNNPRVGFSTANVSDITPGQCIAYRITATNRANVAIDNFVMRDTLQRKGVNGAPVTSVLTLPALSTTDYTATENPAIGTNGEIKTKVLSLVSRTKRDFYFNTKYGTTMDTQ
ncbi:hypothetical protein ACT3TH_00675 [Psychrobacter sp. AOP22-C1-C5]|uniref:hypothetical protein n=1 Tax=Psychrobacter sp. AOP22-C1-C5 TaxID=3457716 RepID=UPI004035ABE6